MWRQAIELLGVGSGATFAATTYGIFHFLDKVASDAAKSAIVHWLRRNIIDKEEFQRVVLGLFDRVYTYPLLSVKTFIRSSLISFLVWTSASIFAIAETATWDSFINHIAEKSVYMAMTTTLIRNIISDFVCLFPIRQFLLASNKPIVVVTIAPFFITFIVIVLMNTITNTIYGIILGLPPIKSINNTIRLYYDFITLQWSLFAYIIFSSAILVTIWLPLFGLSAGLIRLLGPLLKAILWVQWFIKKGSDYPLRAIGVVAAALVFTVISVGQLFR